MKKIIVLIIVLSLLALVGYRVYQTIVSKRLIAESGEGTEIPVVVEEIKLGTIEEKLFFTGNVQAQSQITVYSEVSGKVEKLAVDVGDMVAKGGLIAEIEKEKLVLQVERLEAALESAEANLENLGKDYERFKNLLQQNAVSQQKFDGVKTAYESAQAQVKELKASLKLSKIQLSDSAISAPIGGVIAQKFIEEGDMVAANSQPVVSIADMDSVKVIVDVTDKDIVDIRVGQTARVMVDAYPSEIFEGKVSNVSPVLDLSSRTAPVEIDIPNADHSLKPGMFARVDLVLVSIENAVVIPRDSIIEKDGKKYVFVAENGKARQKEVAIGLEETETVQILSGLKKGEILIIEGQNSAQEGAEIKIIE
ncbi:MAG: efflux RND transporter periplasmic adaptor subunit [Candidatus Ratteibacteria bacterium]|nr:efflux RND transporter periplasmic adaptor subunit [Candidatus Ratteibacteria bacterium]